MEFLILHKIGSPPLKLIFTLTNDKDIDKNHLENALTDRLWTHCYILVAPFENFWHLKTSNRDNALQWENKDSICNHCNVYWILEDLWGKMSQEWILEWSDYKDFHRVRQAWNSKLLWGGVGFDDKCFGIYDFPAGRNLCSASHRAT